jgi:serine/threonine-protein kinase
VVKIIDFGLATRVDRIRNAHGGPATLTAGLRGTPEYMAPERFVGNDCDWHADVYSLGVMAYEMLKGNRPFDNVAAGRWALALARPVDDDVSMNPNGPLVPESIGQIINRALARDPQRRPTAEEFAVAFAIDAEPASG